jgi:hypothetical protein
MIMARIKKTITEKKIIMEQLEFTSFHRASVDHVENNLSLAW